MALLAESEGRKNTLTDAFFPLIFFVLVDKNVNVQPCMVLYARDT